MADRPAPTSAGTARTSSRAPNAGRLACRELAARLRFPPSASRGPATRLIRCQPMISCQPSCSAFQKRHDRLRGRRVSGTMAGPPWPAGAAWIDGQYRPVGDAKISVLDLGVTRSDCTYDVVHVWEGRFYRLDAHLDRFAAHPETERPVLGQPRGPAVRHPGPLLERPCSSWRVRWAGTGALGWDGCAGRGWRGKADSGGSLRGVAVLSSRTGGRPALPSGVAALPCPLP